MKKKYSLKRNEEIAKLVHLRRFVKNDCFVIHFNSNNKEHTRICISVSKKNGKAVIRNKYKRQIREMITALFNFNIKADYVIVVRNNYGLNDFSTNKEKLNELYLKIISKLQGENNI